MDRGRLAVPARPTKMSDDTIKYLGRLGVGLNKTGRLASLAPNWLRKLSPSVPSAVPARRDIMADFMSYLEVVSSETRKAEEEHVSRTAAEVDMNSRMAVAYLPRSSAPLTLAMERVEQKIDFEDTVTEHSSEQSAQEHSSEQSVQNRRIVIEAVAHLTEYPSLLVKNGMFSDPARPQLRVLLNAYKDPIIKAIQAVGRVENSRFEHMGTAWLITKNMVITNTHVAREMMNTQQPLQKFAMKLGNQFLTCGRDGRLAWNAAELFNENQRLADKWSMHYQQNGTMKLECDGHYLTLHPDGHVDLQPLNRSHQFTLTQIPGKSLVALRSYDQMYMCLDKQDCTVTWSSKMDDATLLEKHIFENDVQKIFLRAPEPGVVLAVDINRDVVWKEMIEFGGSIRRPTGDELWAQRAAGAGSAITLRSFHGRLLCRAEDGLTAYHKPALPSQQFTLLDQEQGGVLASSQLERGVALRGSNGKLLSVLADGSLLCDADTLADTRNVLVLVAHHGLKGLFPQEPKDKFYVDFIAENDNNNHLRVEIENITFIAGNWQDELLFAADDDESKLRGATVYRPDIAVLKLKDDGRQLLEPIPMAFQVPQTGEDVVVIGFPAKMNGRNAQAHLSQEIDEIFHAYSVKHVSVGKVEGILRAKHQGIQKLFLHVSPTLGGNSGSVVLNVRTGNAIGLHFGSLTHPDEEVRLRAGLRLADNHAYSSAFVRKILQQALPNTQLPDPYAVTLYGLQDHPDRGTGTSASTMEGVEGAIVSRAGSQVGYNDKFLGEALHVPMPVVQAMSDDSNQPRSYTHFSVLLNHTRKLAWFSASHIDGSKLKTPPPEPWIIDPDVVDSQLDDSFYGPLSFEIGRLSSVVWAGDDDEAKQACVDSFCYTNAAPYWWALNQDFWTGLEEHFINKAAPVDRKLCVFTGPVLNEADPRLDPPPDGVAIPLSFWKVIVIARASEQPALLSFGFLINQAGLVDITGVERPPTFDATGIHCGDYVQYQLPISELELLTGLHFGNLSAVDVLQDQPSFQINSLSDVRVK